MAELDQLNVATRRFIRTDPALVDAVFHPDPFTAYLKSNLQVGFPGGTLIQEGFLYDGQPGGAYAKGEEFDITEKQIEQSLQFQPRFSYANVSMTKEDIQVLNKGVNAVFSLVKARVQSAFMTLGAHISIANFLNGQRAGYTKLVNGLAEAVNDNSTASWDGSTYTTYGGITRGGSVGASLNGTVNNVAGVITYNTLVTQYMNGTISPGEGEPNIGVTTPKCFAFLSNRFQTQQRFNDTQDPKIGFNGLKFFNSTIMWSRYVPGADISGDASNTVTKIANAFLNESSDGVVTAYPTLTAETLWFLNARSPYARMYVSDDPEFSFGFTGFKPAQGNTKISGQVLLSYAITIQPRYQVQLFGITG